MSRVSLLAVLLVGLCLAGQTLGSGQRRRSQSSQEMERDFPGAGQQQLQPFRPNQEYTFTYNGQISTGLQQNTGAGGDPAQQKSATRIQARAAIHFHSERHATLSLQQIRFGHLNERIAEPQQVQPMGAFEPAEIGNEKRRELELPCAFTYEDGVITRVNFHDDDSTWSKNIKRAVINMVQLNLKQNNAQGLRVEGQALSAEQQQQQQQQQGGQFTQVFTIPEVTIEGECQTTYTINQASRQGQRQSGEGAADYDEQQGGWPSQSGSCSGAGCFNVTKSINFQQCSRIADVAYGYQQQQQQPQCAECQRQWAEQQLKNQRAGQQPQQQQQQLPGACDQCDPKEVKESNVERSTVQRFVLAGKANGKYAINRVELVSQYLYKNLRAEEGTTMQAVVAAELIFRGSKQQSPQGDNQQVKQLQQAKASTERDESLLYSNSWDVEEKRFYMYGDEDFIQNAAPFAKVTSKIEQAQTLVRKLIQAASNKGSGIEVEDVVQIQRLAELLRMCTGAELKEIQSALSSSQQQGGSGNSEADRQKVQHILGDALAIAGTRNTINALAEQIINHQLSPAKAAQCLKTLNGLPAPSDSQATIVQNLCKNELVNRHPALKQSCWLTFGAIVGEVCGHKTQKNAQQTPFGSQSGFNKDETCPVHKKEIYKKTLIERYEQATSTYEKVLVLKAIGNAGIDSIVPQLEQIIKDKREQQVPRIQAIDALRRLRTQLPRKIQRILLPIFLNTRENPQVRMAAFSMIMNTQPERPIVDQIAYTLTKERSQQVQSFVYTTMKALAKSNVPCQQSLAKHLKSALKLANVDEATLRSGSCKYQVPIYSEQEQEGLFLTLTSVISSRSAIPNHLSVNLDTLINGEFEVNNIKASMTQQGIEQWYEKVMQQVLQQAQQYVQQQPTRGQRSQQQGQGRDELNKLFKALGIQSRQQGQGFSSNEQFESQNGQNGQQEQPFGMIGVRIGDVDQCMLAIDKQSLPAFVRQMLNGQKPSLRSLMESLEQQPTHFRLLTAQNLNEKSAKIATPLGIPLRVLSAFPILAGIEGQIKLVEGGEQKLESSGSQKLQLSVHPSIAIAHVQRMETWLPVIATGVESVRCVEANVPVLVEAQASRQKGLELNIKLPQGQKTRVFGLHTLPVTYHRDFDQRTKMLKNQRVKKIHNEELEQMQRDVQKTVGQQMLGMPFRVQGHYHAPASLSSYKALVQLLMATENQVHINYEPTPDSPRGIRLSATGNAFEKINSDAFDSHRPQLKEFYSNSVKFEQAEDYSDMQLEDHNQRRQKLDNFVSSYQPEHMYKHQIQLTAETIGGAKRVKAQMKVEGACDAQLKYCKLFTTVERSPLGANEQQPWQLSSKVQIIAPEYVSSVQQLNQVEKKHQKFVCQADTQWGTTDSKKQSISLRIQGEKASKPMWQQSHQMRQQLGGNDNEQQSQKAYQKKTAFLNKFDMVADYKLSPASVNAFARAFETLKAKYFWSVESQPNSENQLSQRSSTEGQVYATVVIDPITQKHANISVKTPTEKTRLQQVELPTHVRPFPLVRQQSEQATHSVGQMFQRLGASNGGRATCSVNGQSVNTFDNVVYTAPISNCYSVLAKDCSSDQPQFSVLMKSLGQQQQSGQQQPKKLKVITPEQTIECQPQNPNSQQPIEEQQLKCTVNGREIGNQNQQQSAGSFENQADVQYDNQDKTSCTINLPGVQVRFNGAKATIKLSNSFKNGQCGLCGHYNDQAADEWRLPNNAHASNLDEFHRSYAVQDDQECNAQEQQQFYNQNKGKFVVQSSEEFGGRQQKWANNQQQRDQGYQSAYSDEYDSDDSNDDDEQSWWGQPKRSGSQWKQQQQRGGNQFSSSNSQEEVQQPIKKTKVIEYTNLLCFSTVPVKTCPEGTQPANNANDEPISGEQQQGGKKVQFACLPRSSIEGRRLQRQARQGAIVDVSSLPPNFVEAVKQPTSCRRY